MNKSDKIYIAGHTGLAGSAIFQYLKEQGYNNLIVRSHKELDLTDRNNVDGFMLEQQPDYVFLAAAKVGGILANDSYPADFIRENLEIQTNVIDAAWRHNVKKLLFLGSACIYPRDAKQPISEDALLTGELEPTNQWYALAKIAGIKMCQAYRRQYGFNAICLMPTNLYGPGDNFDIEKAHVLAALLRRFHEAAENNSDRVLVWGTGKPRREFLHAYDLAEAAAFLMKNYDDEAIINVGCGEDIAIIDLASKLAEVVGYQGRIEFDPDRADGTPRRVLDVSKLTSLGWQAGISLDQGLKDTYQWYLRNETTGNLRLQV